jgi:hypothetical protein
VERAARDQLGDTHLHSESGILLLQKHASEIPCLAEEQIWDDRRRPLPLEAYVKQGGTPVSEARLGWSNEHGYASDRIPGMDLWKVKGCRETAVEIGAKGVTKLRWTGAGMPGMKDGDLLPARWYEETLEPLSDAAKVVARFPDGAAAAVASSYGQGKTLLLGRMSAQPTMSRRPRRETQRFCMGLLEWAAVTLPVSASGLGNTGRTSK